MTNRATDLNRILLLLLCACLLLPLFPGAAAEESLPCAAELSAGAVFYTGRDLKEAIGTLQEEVQVICPDYTVMITRDVDISD